MFDEDGGVPVYSCDIQSVLQDGNLTDSCLGAQMHQQKMRHRAQFGINNPYFKSLTKRLCKGFMRGGNVFHMCARPQKYKCFGGN